MNFSGENGEPARENPRAKIYDFIKTNTPEDIDSVESYAFGNLLDVERSPSALRKVLVKVKPRAREGRPLGGSVVAQHSCPTETISRRDRAVFWLSGTRGATLRLYHEHYSKDDLELGALKVLEQIRIAAQTISEIQGAIGGIKLDVTPSARVVIANKWQLRFVRRVLPMQGV